MAALPFADGASFRRGSLLAALAHGLPTITTTTDDRRPTNVQMSRRGVSNQQLSEATLLIPPNDSGALAAALRRLSGDAALRERLGARGRALAAQFSWDAIAAQHEALYRGMHKMWVINYGAA